MSKSDELQKLCEISKIRLSALERRKSELLQARAALEENAARAQAAVATFDAERSARRQAAFEDHASRTHDVHSMNDLRRNVWLMQNERTSLVQKTVEMDGELQKLDAEQARLQAQLKSLNAQLIKREHLSKTLAKTEQRRLESSSEELDL